MDSLRALGRRLTKRSTWYVIGYNWLVAATVLPFALLVSLPLSLADARVSYACCAAYLFLEATAYCVERNWSRIDAWRFWRLAAVVCVVQALLVLLVAPRDPHGCLLFSGLCLGLREAAFELLHASTAIAGYDIKERTSVALVGGFTYSAVLTLLCGSAYVLIHATANRWAALPLHVMMLFCVLVLPLGRAISRILLTQASSAATLALQPRGAAAAAGAGGLSSRTPEPGSAAGRSAAAGAGGETCLGPPLDALVLYSDMTLALTMFIEVPFAFALLLVPNVPTFWLTAWASAAFDVFFVYLLDTLQRRRLRLSECGPKAAAGPESGLEQWSPSFCFARPVSFVAALLSGTVAPSPGASEAERLRKGPPGAASAGAAEGAKGAGKWENWASQRNCGLPLGGEGDTADGETGGGGGARAMSPRVSLLLDEYDAAVIECRKERSSGEAVYLLQDRKASFSTHLLGNTVAIALACLLVPVCQLQRFGGHELAWRVVALLLLRLLADFHACWTFDCTAGDVPSGSRAALCESRHDLKTLHGWAFRALVSICPLFAVVSAAKIRP